MGEHALVPEDLPEPLLSVIGPYLSRQRWYAGEGVPRSLSVVSSACIARRGGPDGRLLWAIVEADGSDYQLVIAERPDVEGADRVRGHEEALIATGEGHLYHDATVDSEMAVLLLAAASGGAEHAERARPLAAEQSNTSIVYDDRLILKLFRRLAVGANPDVEVTYALAATGFSHIATPLVRWRHDGRDLAFGQEYLAGGTDGWALALTSLRDFYGAGSSEAPSQPAMSGGDFAAEAARLGQMTAEMHLAMAGAYATWSDLAGSWEDLVESLEAQVAEVQPDLAEPGRALVERLQAVADPGPSVRVHGDYHLGQVMRTDSGWYVLDFEGEPSRPLDQRLQPTSVMKDVAGMLRSLGYASRFAMGERAEGDANVLGPLAEAWRERNGAAFLHGYYGCKGVEALLPPADEDREAVRVAFELEKALYEVRYDETFRPKWAAIPRAALQRLLTRPVEVLLAPPAGTEPPAEEGGDDGA
ncbi:MAG: phosphotransferase [Acidimicrobiales bacterium]